MLKPIFENIPDELKDVPQWVNWREIPRKDDPLKMTKPPYQPNGLLAESNNPETWSPFDAVKTAANRFDGLGFVLTKDDPYTSLDFDDCRCPAYDMIDMEISQSLDMVLPVVADHLRKFNTYCEVSPSGCGIRVFLKGKLPVDGKKSGGFEAYQAKHYMTMTGHVIDGFPLTVEHRQEALDTFYQEVFGTPEKPVRQEHGPQQDKRTGDWKILLEKAFNSKSGDKIKQLWNGDFSGHASHSEGDLALCSHLAFWFGGDTAAIDSAFRESGLMREKWDEKHYGDGQTYGEATISKAIEGCNKFYDPDHHDEYQSRLMEFNGKYAAAMLGSRFVIIDETGDEIEFLRLNDFKNYHLNEKIKIVDANGNEKAYPLVDQWLKWEGRRQHPRIEFKPGKDIAPKYNLWRGFAVTAKKGDWSLMQDHIEKNICRGNEKYYRYVYYWVARIYQYPGGERPGVALVFRGKPGTGKGVFARYCGKPLINHFVPVWSPNQFVGKFNAHLKHCVLLFADEAFMSDNKEATGILKGMITEPYIMCEPKGIDAYQIENHINLIAASNSSYIVPAGEAERRFCVIDVTDKRMQDTEYFKRLCDQMDNGGVEAMFHDLLSLDISRIDLRNFPRSNALFDQQLRGMSHIQQWWFECLKFGSLDNESFGDDNVTFWPVELRIDQVRDKFAKYLESVNVKNQLSHTLFGRELRKLCSDIYRDRRKGDDDERGYFYKFPPLDECRKQFCIAMKFEIQWDDF